MKSTNLSVLVIAVFISVLSSTAYPKTSKAKIMVYGETGRLDAYDGYTSHEASAQRLSDLVLESLLYIDAAGKYTGGLARTWRKSKDGTYITIRLKPNVYWHPSPGKQGLKKLSSADVVTTVEVLQSPKSQIPNRERFQIIDRVEVIDDLQIKVFLTRASADPLRALMFKILPAHKFSSEKHLNRKSAFAKEPIGTGPYRFAATNRQGEVRLERFAKYHSREPKLEAIVLKQFSDQSVMAQSLMYRSLDLVTYVSPRDLGEVVGDKDLGVLSYDALSYSFFALNTKRGVLADKRVRQAINHAINRGEMLKAFFANKGQLISGPFPPSSWAYNIDVKPYEFSSDRARALLQRAGLRDVDGDRFFEDKSGKPLKLQFVVPMTGEGDAIKRLSLALQGYLKQVGIRCELKFLDWINWKKKVLGKRDYDLTIASWSFDDASNITSLFHSSSVGAWGNNFVQYQNPEVDTLLTAAQASNDFDKRRAIYHRLHAILADEAPYVYLWTLMHHAAYGPRLSGVRVEPASFFKHIAGWRLKEPADERR